MWDFPIELTFDEKSGRFVVTFPDIPEVTTQGKDRNEALFYAREAFSTTLTMYIETQRDLPSPSPAKGRPTISPDALGCAKLGIYAAMREQGVHNIELARRLHWHYRQVDQLLDLNHASKLTHIEKAAISLGKRVELRIA